MKTSNHLSSVSFCFGGTTGKNWYWILMALCLSLPVQVWTTPGSAFNNPVIDIWYGDTQEFGNNGEPQVWCNIAGNVSDPDGSLTAFYYTLNGGTPVNLNIGPDNRRLLESGDFNVDLTVGDLVTGTNTVVITAIDNDANETQKTVTVNYTPGNVWTNPYSIDWSTLADESDINDVAHVVDGKWQLTPDGIRTEEPGYDRLIAIGDKTWTNYEVLVPFTINSSMPGGGGVGVLLRWKGHTDNPVTCSQPKCGWQPLGDIAWYRPGQLQFYEGNNTSRTLNVGVTYMMRTSVETTITGGTLYRLKVWEEGTSEPIDWDLEYTAGLGDEQEGSLLLISHLTDVTFGNVMVTPGSLSITNTQVQLNAAKTEATVTWSTNQPASSAIDYGPTSAYENGTLTDAALTTNHSLTLTGLSPDEVYHYQITAENAAMEVVTSGDLQFSTYSAGIKSDDFCNGILDPVWTFYDPQNDASYALTGSGTTDGWLEISVPANAEHQMYDGGIQAPNLLQSMNNADFEVEVKFESSVVTPQYQEQGILVKESANKYLRFEFFSKSPGQTIIYAQGFDLPTASTPFVNMSIGAEGIAPLYMRVKRLGNQWTQSYSTDGTNWMVAASFSYPLNPTEIGPYAGNALGLTSPAHTAQIDYFLNLDDPITNEDGCSAQIPPQLSAIGNQTVEEGGSLTINLSATDPNGDDANIDFSTSTLPGFVQLTDNNDGTASLQVNPLMSDAGSYPITVTVTDEEQLTDNETFNLIVTMPGGGASGLVSDDFCSGVLSGAWTYVDPLGDGSLAFSGAETSDAWLALSVPGGSDHQMWTSGMQAPHIIQSANDVDFEVELKMESPVVAPQFQMQGIVIKQDDFNFLRFEIYSTNSNTYALGAILSSGTSSFPLASSIPINGSIGALGITPIYVRVKREGNLYTFSYSFDGSAWQDAGTLTAAFTVAEVGVYGGNAGGGGAPTHTAQFDYFTVSDAPLPTEDDCTSGNATLSLSATLQGHTSHAATFSLDVYQSDSPIGTSPDYSFAPVSDALGNMEVSGIDPGTYDLVLKYGKSLSLVETITLVDGANSIDMGMLLTGDANDDNLVELTDFSILASVYGLDQGDNGYDGRADFTGDDAVELTDFSILASNYGLEGETRMESAPPLRTPDPTRSLGTATAHLRANRAIMSSGKSTYADVWLQTAEQAVDGTDLTVQVDPRLVRIDRVEWLGGFSLPLKEEVDPVSGQVDLAVGSLQDFPKGNIPVMRIHFTALRPGEATLAFAKNGMVTSAGKNLLRDTRAVSLKVTGWSATVPVEAATPAYLRLFPNPATDQIMVNWTTGQADLAHELIVYDAIGRVIERRTFRGPWRETISLATYARGTYIIQVRSGEEVVTKRFFRK
jgi:hypothetical protein